MVEIETVLILGAGAGKAFDFPSGKELVGRICDMLGDIEGEPFRICYAASGLPKDRLIEFRKTLKRADPPSIDAWLEHNPGFLEVGRVAIAVALLDCERRSNLSPPQNWYQFLFGKLSARFDEFGKNNLSIVTFNYDRSLEYYLFRVFRHTHTGRSEAECKAMINKLHVLHVYGSLGPLEWQTTDADLHVPYCARLDLSYVQRAAGNIRIMPEGRQGISNEFAQAHRLMDHARAVYFLGFGYHDFNMQRLGIEFLRKVSKVMGTAYGLDYQRLREVERLGIQGLDTQNGLIQKPVYEFLYKYVDFNELGLPSWYA